MAGLEYEQERGIQHAKKVLNRHTFIFKIFFRQKKTLIMAKQKKLSPL